MLSKNWWKQVLCRQAPYISEFLFMIVTRLSRIFLSIVRRSSIHRLQLGFVNAFIVPIGFGCFTTLNVMYLRKSVRDVVVLKCCLKCHMFTWCFVRFFDEATFLFISSSKISLCLFTFFLGWISLLILSYAFLTFFGWNIWLEHRQKINDKRHQRPPHNELNIIWCIQFLHSILNVTSNSMIRLERLVLLIISNHFRADANYASSDKILLWSRILVTSKINWIRKYLNLKMKKIIWWLVSYKITHQGWIKWRMLILSIFQIHSKTVLSYLRQ